MFFLHFQHQRRGLQRYTYFEALSGSSIQNNAETAIRTLFAPPAKARKSGKKSEDYSFAPVYDQIDELNSSKIFSSHKEVAGFFDMPSSRIARALELSFILNL